MRLVRQLILGEKADGLDCCRAGLGYGLRDILRSLADTGKEHTGGGGLYRTKLRMSLGEEVVGIDAGGQHGSQSFCTEGSGSMAAARTTISAFIEDLLVVQIRSTP